MTLNSTAVHRVIQLANNVTQSWNALAEDMIFRLKALSVLLNSVLIRLQPITVYSSVDAIISERKEQMNNSSEGVKKKDKNAKDEIKQDVKPGEEKTSW